MAEGDLVALQTNPEAPRPGSVSMKTDMMLAPTSTADRLRHFSEEVYDLSAESHLIRFVKVLLGDAGAGQVRKRMMVQRLQSTLQGSHFFDLDRFYGPLFGLRRTPGESIDFDPYTQTATTEHWDDALAKDASFRSRISQFAKALSYGPTPTGMELLSEALLAVDCEVYESYIQADESYQTYAELEAQYGEPNNTYADMEGVSYGTLEGEGLARMSGDERRVFTVRPKRRITLSEAHDLRRVLSRVKPADSRLLIDHTGIPLHEPLEIMGAKADSEHWEILSAVASQPSAVNPYQEQSATPVEQPRPPFSGYQGEAWSYNADIVGANAFTESIGGERTSLPTQRVTFADSFNVDFPPPQAIMPRRSVQAGRVVSDGILVAHPYPGPRGVPAIYQDRYVVSNQAEPISRLYADGIPLDDLNTLLKTQASTDPYQQNPESRFWVSTERSMGDDTREYLDLRLSGDRLINYVTLEVARFPHEVVVEVYETLAARWVEVHRQTITTSSPRMLAAEPESVLDRGHPQHSYPGHWEKISVRTPRVMGSQVRVRLTRVLGIPPQRVVRSTEPGIQRTLAEVPYSLAIRSLDLGYRVTSRKDFDFLGPEAEGLIASTQDVAGSLVQFRVHEHKAANLLTDAGFWRSEPQPVNYAAVSLYLDTRGPGNGDGTVIDRFYLEPTHVGPHFTIYYSNDPQDTDGTDEFYEGRTWTPIPRDYTLQKGYAHLPPTRARYWKFEFTNLVAEPYETFLPITRKVRLFPGSLVSQMGVGYGKSDSQMPEDMRPLVDSVVVNRYLDALNILSVFGAEPSSEVPSPTEALYMPNLDQQVAFRKDSWVFGFTPWHQGTQAPRFDRQGRHYYDETEVRQTTKVAFFVGLKSIEAFRVAWEADEDTPVYFDTFDDFRNLTPGFTWTFDPGYMHSGATPQNMVEATSRTFTSLHNVEAVQFATEQSDPIQLVPNDDFRDQAMATYEWNDPDYFLRVGDAQLIYSASDHSVLNLRHVIPPPKPLDPTPGIVQPVHHPAFAVRPFTLADEEAAAQTEGGLASPLVLASSPGRVYAAVRVTLNTEMTNPLLLQVVMDDGTVLAEKPISGRNGQTIEEYMPYDVMDPEVPLRVRLIQRGKSSDAWRLDTLSLFEDSITWEFSVNGGGDWLPALGVRNNDNGVLTFPEVGNQLRFRVRGFRANQWVSAIKIRPWYVGAKNARPSGTHRGPNLSYYDHDVPIHEDPMFTSWKKPIPYWWFSVSKKYPMLPVEGVPNTNEYSRFYGRPAGEEIATVSDSVAHQVIQRRFLDERLDYTAPTSDSADRKVTAFRGGVEGLSLAQDAVDTLMVLGMNKAVLNTLVKPVFSERNPNHGG